MSKSVIEKHLASALALIGIPVVEQRLRRLSFHSWRHFLNTMLRSCGVPDAKVREITGHRSEQMSKWYAHLRTGDFGEVVELQTMLLAPPAALAAV
jgi:integrase